MLRSVIKEVKKRKRRAKERERLRQNRDKRISLTIYPKILVVMKEERPFLDPSFTLADLASLVGSNRTYVTNAMKYQGTSFFEVVAIHRCRYAFSLVDKDLRISNMGDLAHLSGFKSKRSMCAYMKELYPKEYKIMVSNIKKRCRNGQNKGVKNGDNSKEIVTLYV